MTEKSLKGSQRKALRGLAHHLRPVVQVGRAGMTAAVVASVDEALAANELIKVQLAGERDERHEMAAAIAAATASECVGTLGRIAIFYRQHPDADKRRIALP